VTEEPTPIRNLDTRWLGRSLVRLGSIDSTNKEVWRRAEAGGEHGLVVVAAEQTAGRGRLDRSWVSPHGEGLYVTGLLRPGELSANAGLLGIAAGLAAAGAVEDVGVPAARVKWPNDVWVEDRKIAGILVEARDAGKQEGIFVVGVGINVAQTTFPDGLRVPATSVRLVTGEVPDLNEVLCRLLERFELWVDTLVDGKLDALDAAFSARDMLTGRRIGFTLSGAEVAGEVLSISPLSGVTLRLDSGEEKTFPPDHVNEVRVACVGGAP
jgi:BirA family transcriptional regulator, biotin operon repressor / biotin---[acetyl-CoA-carboxylase] ligase